MIPTLLWIGQHDQLIENTYAYLEKELGISPGNFEQEQLRNRQNSAVRWLSPEKNNYRRADLEQFFADTAYLLSDGQRFFVIFEHADQLPPACANSLLKMLEEPPYGYQFILLAQQKDLILPTIISRTVATEINSLAESLEYHKFMELLKNPAAVQPFAFMQELEALKITEYQTRTILDRLINYWAETYKKSIQSGDSAQSNRAERMQRIIAYAQEQLPMPGSSKLFWKNLYLLLRT